MNSLRLKRLDRLNRSFDISFLDVPTAETIARYHASFPMYRPTPLVPLKHLARHLGVNSLWVKDESHRFGLNAFKVLGGSYALGRIVAKRLREDLRDLPYQRLVSQDTRKRLGPLTFVTATDGNHGRGIAWGANQLHQNSVVFMPAGSAQERADNITREGAQVHILPCNYDEAVRRADQLAKEKGYILVQDTAWPGYEDIPRWIMQGYMTMAWEILEAMRAMNTRPTHVFLQAGVGSLAAAVVGFFANAYPGDDAPVFTIVEPHAANCVYRSAVSGKRELVGGQHDTIMAGLACGEPNTEGLQVLMHYAENYLSAPDCLAAYGMRVLGHPLADDPRIISGESGAAPLGVIAKALSDPSLAHIREQLRIGADSALLFISTEGDTDRQSYLDIVWDGRHASR